MLSEPGTWRTATTAPDPAERVSARLEILFETTRAFAETTTDLPRLLDLITEKTGTLIGDLSTVSLSTEDGNWLRHRSCWDPDPAFRAYWYEVMADTLHKVGESVTGRVAASGEPEIVAQADPQAVVAGTIPELRELLTRMNPHSFLVVPMRSRGRVIGVISLVRRRPGFPYDAEDQAFLQDVADRAALAVDNAKVYANLERRVRDRTTEVAAANRQLEAINRELETFAYSVSHDLRAPLRALDGFSLALLEDFADRLPGDAQDYLRRIRAASQRMGDLIDALLDLARVGRLPLVTAEIDLSALASAVGAELAAASPDRRVDLRVEGDLRTQGDARLLRVVMQNLLGNAWKFTGGTPDPEIQVGSATLADAPAFFVRDNGAGFDMRHADKLFGAFQRLHGAAEFPGTGIGLATVQRIIHRHGGQIRGDGRPGEGATFTFTLPAGPADAPPGPS